MTRLLVIFIFVVVVVVGVVAANMYVFLHTPSGETEQFVVIERGTSPNKILKELEEKGIISNDALFKMYLLLKHASGKIRAGEYHFPPRLMPSEVMDLLLKGDFAKRRVMIPEGWNTRDIAKYLGELKLVDPDLLLKKCSDPVFIQSLGFSTTSLEGYLFPDTYEIYKPKDEEEVLKKFVDRFREIYSKEFETKAKERGLTQEQVVIIASIVEKETGHPDERPLIASVFFNRLKIDMPLASDPTIIYGIPNFNGNITREDLNRPSPYNSYVNRGLPPTAIANPGEASLKAVLYPAESEYLYFVSKNDGTHHFSKTEEEHKEAVRRYQLNRPKPEPQTMPETIPQILPVPLHTL